MPTPDEMRSTLHRYLDAVGRQDLAAVLALFADDVSVEDPVGGPPGTHVVGRDAVEVFFGEGFARSRPRPRLTGPICTTGSDRAAMAFVLELTLRGARFELDVIDEVAFDREGRITSLRAFWNAADAREIDPGPR